MLKQLDPAAFCSYSSVPNEAKMDQAMNYLKDLIYLIPKHKGLHTIQDIAIKDGNLYLVSHFR